MSARWRRTRADRRGQADLARAHMSAEPATPVYPGDELPDAIGDILGELLELRLTLVADLSAAAAAIEDDSERVGADIIDGDRRELAAFLRRSRTRLQDVPGAATPVPAVTASAPGAPALAVPGPRSWRRRALISLPAIPLVGALAMSAAAAAGLLPLPTQSHDHHARVVSEPPVSTTFQQFENVLAGDPSASQVVEAASALHRQIAAMLAAAPQSPGGVSEVARLLQLEQALLMRKQPPGSSLVLAQSRQLAAQLQSVARAASVAPVPTSTSTHSEHHSSAPRPTTSATPTSRSTTARPAPTATPTSSPSPSSSDGPAHLPSFGG